MTRSLALAAALLGAATTAYPQAALAPAAAAKPTLEEARRAMAVPSKDDVRGQLDGIGFASTAKGMAKAWDLSTTGPDPLILGPAPAAGVAGAICPHDDYLYAARVYRRVLPLVTAKTVVLVGVFHKYRRFGEHDRLVFDPYREWRAPDGPVTVSALRDELLAGLPADAFVQDAAMHDSEHSLEALVYWLRHARPDVEIVPIIVPAASMARLEDLARLAGTRLADVMKKRGLRLGTDVAVVVSSDAVHYGPDFKFTPYGEGGVEAYVKATAHDRALLEGPLAGPLTAAKVRSVYADFVDVEHPDVYRNTWCGRFAVPFGLSLLRETAERLGDGAPVGRPLAYATSVGWPELPLRDVGMGATAPDSLYHFVGYPAVAYTLPAMSR